ncbi:sensor histidine kinase [Paenibacillus cremeus]|uniref:Sensor histidine kinase n=1 Tax=Paenibacillus cremeus TaxID=2163881 RepID=A0A559K640_9BACL|nr:sensor histidine kinase [Paenibacillus cremeus]TVY07573.1 sensor histidine kinase [Paenibacillus cremeus]
MQVLRWFQDLTIRKKLQFINVLIILPSIVLLTFTLYQMTLKQAEERALRSSEQKIELIANTIGNLFSDIENFSKLSMINKTFQSVLMNTSPENSELQRLEDVQTVYESLNTLAAANPYIDSVILQSAEGDRIYHSDNMSNVTLSSISVYPVQQLIDAKGTAVWIDTFESPFLVNDQRKSLISIGRRVININNGLLAGFFYINVDELKLSGLYGSGGTQGRVMIVNGLGQIVSSNDRDIVNRSLQSLYGSNVAQMRSSAIVHSGRQNVLVSSRDLGKEGWRAIYAVPTKELLTDQWNITLFILGFGGAGLLLALILSMIFSNWITTPITQLTRAMTAVGDGLLDTRTPVRTNDEVGRLTRKFNEMVGRIQDLMAAVNAEEKQKRVLELRLSYSQIKPHFLYNTLEMVRSMALMVQQRDIAKVVKSLADFYRSSLNGGQEVISVAQERKHLESYLYIQKMRYHHIDYRIDFDSRLEDSRVPNMLLQPLVENAIYHGLRNKRDGALCEIFGALEDDGGLPVICFTVCDNGEGMSEEQLERIWHRDQTDHGLSSFGIRNVHDRIMLRYGPGYGLTIRSRPGEGVEVQLRIPIISDKGIP